jgi:hypothetical protein
MRRNKVAFNSPNWTAAGKMIADRARHQEVTLNRWALKHNIGGTTIQRLCNNTFSWVDHGTVGFVWRLADELANHDEEQAQLIIYEFLSKAGMLPRIDEISIVAKLDAILVLMTQARNAAFRIARAKEQKKS